ncbi:MAG: hypothetical protein OEM85_04545 [Gammaproteobacteria bacterium]|nr:hypothetical protein [Gammaproteobacteria bacterium]MDH3372626.1 hypothetical protein [Gammaproteobacteria bacterium]
MSNKLAGGVHWSFWVIGAVALLWSAGGVINYFMQMDPDVLATYRESERAIVDGRPVWATGAFALAVFGGAIGCVLLLFRKSTAFYVFIASLLGVGATTIHTVGIGFDFSLVEILGIILLPLVVAVFLIWYSKWTESKDWIG